MSLKLVTPVTRKKPDLYRLYLNAYIRCMDRAIESDTLIIDLDLIERQRLVYYGVKMINHQSEENMSYENLELRFQTMDFIHAVMSTLTPNDFERVFPIDKQYDGARYERKDYFYTKKMIEGLGADNKIGNTIDSFLWDYQNIAITLFEVHFLSTTSNLRRCQGEKGIMEEFLEDKGITTYTLEEREGKRFIRNNDTGEVSRVKRPVPRHMKVVK